MADVNEDGSTSEFKVDAETQKELDRYADEANSDAEPEEAAKPVISPKHKIKVNGKEFELSTEELIARAQKVESADQYILDASRMRREAENAQNTQKPVPVPTGPTADELLEERRALVRAIQMGTEEEAMGALEKLQRPQRPAFSADDMARTVDERLTFKDAVRRFETDFQDVLSDPVLKQLALQKDQQLLAQGDKRDYWERYSEIGGELRSWKQSLVPTAPAVSPTQQALDSKQQRKANAPSQPKAASARAPATQREDEGEESIGDVIAAIAKARGGPQWSRA